MKEHHRQDSASGFQFIEFVPRIARTTDAVLIYLHGSGERGSDISRVKRYGLPALLDKSETSVNCPVICPQLGPDADWAPDRVAMFIKTVSAHRRQKVLMGYSLGGSGVCEVIGRNGPVVDVAIAISGQAPRCAKVNQYGVKFLAIQGELDPWPCTGSFVESINTLGGAAQTVKLSGKGHYISEEALFHPNVLALLHSVGIRFGGQSKVAR